jgi:6-phosphogluconolactonase
MTVDTYETADDVAVAAASLIAAAAREAVHTRGRFVFAVSGGRTPGAMLRALSREDVPWHGVHVAQVDERLAPVGDPDRNLTGLYEQLLAHVNLGADQIHAMPVDVEVLDAAPARYVRTLAQVAGSPPTLDLVHLGLGVDGHTASLIPGDAVLGVADTDVSLTGVYQGRRRMTMTLPLLNRSRQLLWVVTGAEKAAMLARLLAGDPSIPAGRLDQAHARVIADRASRHSR